MEKCEHGDFFLKSPCWKGKTFSGRDFLADVPVLTQLLCEAIKRVLETWPNISGKTSLSARMLTVHCLKAQCPGQRAAPHFVMPSPGGQRCRDTSTKASLFILYDMRPCSRLLDRKRWIFSETSFRISGWQYL